MNHEPEAQSGVVAGLLLNPPACPRRRTARWKWAIRFPERPTSAGINYERIQKGRDPNLRSVRIDQDWRGIVFKPVQDDVMSFCTSGITTKRTAGGEPQARDQSGVPARCSWYPAGRGRAPNSRPLPWRRHPSARRDCLTRGASELLSLGVPRTGLPGPVHHIRERARPGFRHRSLSKLRGTVPGSRRRLGGPGAAGTRDTDPIVPSTSRTSPAPGTTPESQARFVVVDGEVDLICHHERRWRSGRVPHPTQRARNGRSQWPGTGAWRRWYRQDGPCHAPSEVACREPNPRRQEDPVHDVHSKPRVRHRGQSELLLSSGHDEEDRGPQSRWLGAWIPARSEV